jgi:hypothetical protein
MARSSVLLFFMCAASSLLAQEVANHEEIAMLKAAPCESTENLPSKDRLSLLESRMQDVFTDTALGDCGAKVAAAQPQICSNRLFIKADGLLWKVFFGGNDYAATDTSLSPSILTGEVKRADFRWRWGFRTELGVHLPHDNWDALANYTWFNDKSDQSAVSPVNGTLVPLRSPFTNFAANATASMRWHMLFQNLDIDLKRAYFLSSRFSVTPFFGLRNTWIDHGYAAHYANPNGAPATVIDVNTRQDFWGIGPVGGLGGEWHITSQWWVFGTFAGAILAAKYDIVSYALNSGSEPVDLSGNTQRMSPTVQGALGFGWHMNLNRQRNHIALRVCYEGQYWWKQNLTLDYDTISSAYPVARLGEDLGLHGFTLDVLFDF